MSRLRSAGCQDREAAQQSGHPGSLPAAVAREGAVLTPFTPTVASRHPNLPQPAGVSQVPGEEGGVEVFRAQVGLHWAVGSPAPPSATLCT